MSNFTRLINLLIYPHNLAVGPISGYIGGHQDRRVRGESVVLRYLERGDQLPRG